MINSSDVSVELGLFSRNFLDPFLETANFLLSHPYSGNGFDSDCSGEIYWKGY